MTQATLFFFDVDSYLKSIQCVQKVFKFCNEMYSLFLQFTLYDAIVTSNLETLSFDF